MANFNASPSDRTINKLESIISDDLRLTLDDFSNMIIIEDDHKQRFAQVEKDNKTVRFYKRESNKMDLSCSIFDIQKIEYSSENQSIEVQFKDSTKGIYQAKGETNPVDDVLEIIQEKPIFNGSSVSIESCIRYLINEKALRNGLYFNELDNKIYFDYSMIGYTGTYPYNADVELTTVIQSLEKEFAYLENGIIKYPKVSRNRVDEVLIKIAKENQKNPFLEKVKAAAQNDSYKIESFLTDIGITSRLPKYDLNEKYIKSVSCAIFLSIIERQMVNDEERSIKFVPVIIGMTNLGKSTICKKLGLVDFYRETTKSIDDEKAYNESVQGAIIVEQSEGTHFIAGKEEVYKAHFDKNSYQYRKSYGRESIKIQKRYLEFITSNDNEILTDITGNIRYFPIFLDDLEKPTISIQEHTEEMILSYYADAYQRYISGERWYQYIDDEVQEIADTVRDSVTKDIDGLFPVVDYLNNQYPNIGDFVPRDELKDYLFTETRLDTRTIDKALRLFGKSCDRFGFKKTSPRKTIVAGLETSKRGFERVKKTN